MLLRGRGTWPGSCLLPVSGWVLCRGPLWVWLCLPQLSIDVSLSRNKGLCQEVTALLWSGRNPLPCSAVSCPFLNPCPCLLWSRSSFRACQWAGQELLLHCCVPVLPALLCSPSDWASVLPLVNPQSRGLSAAYHTQGTAKGLP